MTNCATKTPLAEVVMIETSIPISTLSPYFGIQLCYNLFVLHLHAD